MPGGASAYREHRTVTGASIGPANLITGARAGLVLVMAGVGMLAPTRAGAWTVVGVGTVAAISDLADGWVARRTGTTSPFGARFDMEVDAALILVLSAIVWRFGVTGPWVLMSGLLRYAFVAAATPLPWLARPLPPSRRRQTVCVVQIVALLVALGPVVPAGLALASAGIGLAALAWSFAVDIAWLRGARDK
jgi:phosphatidylglycerophosphate synthase